MYMHGNGENPIAAEWGLENAILPALHLHVLSIMEAGFGGLSYSIV